MSLYNGYLRTLDTTTQERATITYEPDQDVLTRSVDEQLASPSDNSKNEQNIPREQTLKDFPCPVQGIALRGVGNYHSEVFDNYLFHTGQDYAQSEGTMIRVTHGGKVIFSGADHILGQKVTLDCGGGWIVTYGGLDNLRVKVGDIVKNQDALGQVGFYTCAESNSDQPQLHYEVWRGSEVQSPS